jgi:hypothetical protein
MTSPASTPPRGSRAERPRPTRTRMSCGRLAGRISVTTCEASALNSTPTSVGSATAGVWGSAALSASIAARSLRRQVPDLSWIVATGAGRPAHETGVRPVRHRAHGRDVASQYDNGHGFYLGDERQEAGHSPHEIESVVPVQKDERDRAGCRPYLLAAGSIRTPGASAWLSGPGSRPWPGRPVARSGRRR